MDEIVLQPLETRAVTLENDELIAALVEQDNKQIICVPITPLVEHLGLDTRSQRRRMSDDPVLSEVARTVRIERPVKRCSSFFCKTVTSSNT